MPAPVTELEKRIIASIQGDMPAEERPYRRIAADLGIEEQRLLGMSFSAWFAAA
jgi:DNA-binding Lrp family transcriptional regulator